MRAGGTTPSRQLLTNLQARLADLDNGDFDLKGTRSFEEVRQGLVERIQKLESRGILALELGGAAFKLSSARKAA